MRTATGMRPDDGGPLDAAPVRHAALLVSFACAGILFFAFHAQRAEWTAMGGRRGTRLLVYPDPNAWNLWASLGGIVALVALLAGLWAGRRAFVAAIAAVAAFAFAAATSLRYWTGPSPDAVPPGRAALGPEWAFHPAGGVWVYAVAALLGIAASLILAAAWRRAAPGEAAAHEAWPRGDGSGEAWFVRMGLPDRVGRPVTAGYDAPRVPAVRGWANGSDGAALALAVACALALVLALIAPPEFARTTWMAGGANRFTRMIDSPAGYVGLLSLCGLAALLGLGLAAASRWLRVVGALFAAAAFAAAAWVAVRYATNVWRGVMGVEGHASAAARWPNEIIDAPELLPVFVLFALAGALGALAYAAAWWPRRAVGGDPASGWPGGNGTRAAMQDRAVGRGVGP